MKRIYVILMICISFNHFVFAQSYSPIPVSGFNQDLVANTPGTALTSTTTAFDRSNMVFFEHGFVSTIYKGLPANNQITSSANSNITYNLASYTGNNVLFMSDNNPHTLTLADPGIYNSISILATSSEGSSTFNVVINYSDGTSVAAATFTVPDWVGGTSNIAISGLYRINREGAVDTGSGGNFKLFDNTLSVDPTKVVQSLTFTKSGTSGWTGIFAICGVTPVGVPDAPTAQAATDITRISFVANWATVSGATNYRIDVATDNTFSNILGSYNNLSVSGTSKMISGLSLGTTYYYRVRSEDANGQSLNSNVTSVTTLSNSQPVANDDGPFSVNTGSMVSGNVLANDNDEDDEDLDVVSVPTLLHGSFNSSFNTETGAFVYSAPTDWAGTFSYNYTVTDGIATDVGTAYITVSDTIIPVVVTKDATVYLNSSGSVTIDYTYIDDGSTDNIGIASYSINKSTFDCANVGTNSVTLTVYDAAGNYDSETATVTVLDNTPPNVNTQNFTLYLDETGNGSVKESDIILSISDNCTLSPNVALTNTDFSCDDVGATESWEYLSSSIAENYSGSAFYSDATGIYMVGKNTISGAIEFLKWGNTDWDLVSTSGFSASPYYFNLHRHSSGNFIINIIDSYEMVLLEYDMATNTWSELVSSTVNSQWNLSSTYNPAGFATHPVTGDIWISFIPASGPAGTYSPIVLKYDGSNVSLVGYPASGITTEWCNNIDISFTSDGAATVIFGARNNPIGPFVISYNGSGWISRGVINSIQGRNYSNRIITTDDDKTYITFYDATAGVTYVLMTTNFTSWETVISESANYSNMSFTKMGNGNIYYRYGNKGVEIDGTTVTDLTGISATLHNAGLFDNPEGGHLLFGNYDYAHGNSRSYKYETGNSISYIVTDGSGNKTSGSVEITVLDTVSPSVVCQNLTVYLDATGSAAIDEDSVDNGSSDACGGLVFDTDITIFGCADVGDNTVTLTVTDANSNSSHCTSTVTIVDTIPPNAVCKDTTVYLDESGDVLIDEDAVDNESSDACGGLVFDTDKTIFGCADVGNNTVTLTVTDVNSNSSHCTSNVTVLDTISPNAVCMDITVYLDESGDVLIDEDAVDNESSDACVGLVFDTDKTIFGCADVGENTVTLTVTDPSSNSSECTSIVTVLDTVPPNISVNPIDIILRENGDYVLTGGDIKELTNGTTDNCISSEEELNIEVSPRFFDCSNAGMEVPLEIIATDINGNKSHTWTTVTVHDTISPVANCEDVELYLDENGEATLLPEMVNAGNNEEIPLWWGQTYNDSGEGSYDACGIESVSIDRESFDCSDAGSVNTVKLTVSDFNGNVSTCTAAVTVIDSTPPGFEAVDDITIELSVGDCETEIEYPEITVTDNCSNLTLEQIEGLGENGSFPVGVTTERWKATDENGNTAEVSFVVNISAVNSEPELGPISNIIAEENSEVVNVSLSGISYGNDCVAQGVTIESASSNPELVDSVKVEYVDGNSTGSLLVFIAPGTTGQSNITVTVKDSEGATTSESFVLKVIKPNHPPYLVTSVPDQFVTVGQELKMPVSNVSGIIFGDAVDTELTLGLTLIDGNALPAWMTMTNDTLQCFPTMADTGCVEVVIRATDILGATARDTFNVFVEENITVNTNNLLTSVFEVNMYPNPTKGNVVLELGSQQQEELELTVMNVAGGEVLRERYTATNRIQFDISEYVSGVYLVILKSGEWSTVKKLILDK